MSEMTLAFVELWNERSLARVAESSENVALFYCSIGREERTFSHRFKKTVVLFVL